MRHFIAAVLWFAFFPLPAFGDGEDYVLRVAHRGYDNWVAGEAQPVEHEIDTVELTIKPGAPFAISARMATTTIRIKGVLRHEPGKPLFMCDCSCSRENVLACDGGASIMAFDTDCELTVGKIQTISEKISVGYDSQGKKSRSRDAWTSELIDATAAQAKLKPPPSDEASRVIPSR